MMKEVFPHLVLFTTDLTRCGKTGFPSRRIGLRDQAEVLSSRPNRGIGRSRSSCGYGERPAPMCRLKSGRDLYRFCTDDPGEAAFVA